MTLIKVIYDNGESTMVKVMREAHKNKKCLADMPSKEMTKILSGLVR